MFVYCKELSEIFHKWKKDYNIEKNNNNRVMELKQLYIIKILSLLKNIAEKNITIVPVKNKSSFVIIENISKL